MQCHGLQCGFCTPGHDDHRPRPARPNPDPTEDDDPRGHLRPDLPVHRLHDDRAVHAVGGQHANGRVVESGPSEEDFAPEAQTDDTMGPEAAEPLLEAGSPS